MYPKSVVVLLLMVFVGTHAFRTVARSQTRTSLWAKKDPSTSTQDRESKRNQKLLGCFATLLASLAVNPPLAVHASEEIFVKNVATMITSKKILEPVDNFVDKSAYDNARTNVKYITNQLQLQKNADSLVRNSLDLDPEPNSDLVDLATEAAGRISTTAENVDSSVYTTIFIPPADDGTIPPSALKYRKQALEFLKAYRSDLDALINVADDGLLAKAKVTSKSTIPLQHNYHTPFGSSPTNNTTSLLPLSHCGTPFP